MQGKHVAYFDCFSGASGDMLLGSLLDAGLDLEDLQADLRRLSVADYHLDAKRVTQRGLSGTQLTVILETDALPARNLPAIEQIIRSSTLSEQVQARSLAVFQRLARAEAAVHGVSVEEVHFHEIGAVDSLVDVVGFACGLQRLAIEEVYCSALPMGGGVVRTAHGMLPVPAPATLALLAEVGAPTVPGPGPVELVTPTGAALLAHWAKFQPVDMTIDAVGYGFGSKEFDWPNALRVWLGRALSPKAAPDTDTVVQLTCNLDDASGQALGYALERLLAAGALDVWFTPIQMKKNRPAIQLALLARPEDAERLAALVLRETPTLGLRACAMQRYKAGRDVCLVETPWGRVHVKVKVLGGQAVDAAPEYDDCARLAQQAGVSLAEVMQAARSEAYRLIGTDTRQAD